VAEYLVREILNRPNENFQPEAQGSPALETSTIIKRPKGRKQLDRSYRPPKSSPSQLDTSEDRDVVAPEAASVSLQLGDELVPCQPDHGDKTMNERSDSLVTDQSIPKCEGEIPQVTAASSPSQPGTPDDRDMVSHEAASVSPQLGDELVPCQPDHGDKTMNERSDSLVTDQSSSKCEEEIPQITAESGSQGRDEDDYSTHGRALSPIANESILHQLQAACTNDGLKRSAVHRQLSVALDQATSDIQTTGRPSSPYALEPEEPTLPEIDRKGSDAQASSDASSPQVVEPRETTLPDPVPSTPVRKLSRESQSPVSDDQTATPQTALFTPTVNKGVLSPLTEGD